VVEDQLMHLQFLAHAPRHMTKTHPSSISEACQ
jgi:hypothetical protein